MRRLCVALLVMLLAAPLAARGDKCDVACSKAKAEKCRKGCESKGQDKKLCLESCDSQAKSCRQMCEVMMKNRGNKNAQKQAMEEMFRQQADKHQHQD